MSNTEIIIPTNVEIREDEGVRFIEVTHQEDGIPSPLLISREKIIGKKRGSIRERRN